MIKSISFLSFNVTAANSDELRRYQRSIGKSYIQPHVVEAENLQQLYILSLNLRFGDTHCTWERKLRRVQTLGSLRPEQERGGKGIAGWVRGCNSQVSTAENDSSINMKTPANQDQIHQLDFTPHIWKLDTGLTLLTK